jgi:hypothetical protein
LDLPSPGFMKKMIFPIPALQYSCCFRLSSLIALHRMPQPLPTMAKLQHSVFVETKKCLSWIRQQGLKERVKELDFNKDILLESKGCWG